MQDMHSYEMNKQRYEYIAKNNNAASANLKKYYTIFNENSSSKEYTVETALNIPLTKVELKLEYFNEHFRLSWDKNKAFEEIKKLIDSTDPFLMHIADICIPIVTHIINGESIEYCEAFAHDIRGTIYALNDILETHAVQVTLIFVEAAWIRYVHYITYGE